MIGNEGVSCIDVIITDQPSLITESGIHPTGWPYKIVLI